MKCNNIVTEKIRTCWIEWPDLWQNFFPYKMLKQEEERRLWILPQNINCIFIYLLICLMPSWKRPTWVQQKCWLPDDGKSVKQNPACHKEQDTDGWDFPRGDATAQERALLLLLRQNTDVSVRRRRQTEPLVCYGLYTSTTAWPERLHQFYVCSCPPIYRLY